MPVYASKLHLKPYRQLGNSHQLCQCHSPWGRGKNYNYACKFITRPRHSPKIQPPPPPPFSSLGDIAKGGTVKKKEKSQPNRTELVYETSPGEKLGVCVRPGRAVTLEHSEKLYKKSPSLENNICNAPAFLKFQLAYYTHKKKTYTT